ncbi:nucleotide exchange factor GrpE [Nocardioides dongxiaopingii]|uniref:nucleotide exchange factor GrpE n=1 Tax=Nocardioides dongxiaopingii TaxID=2576036 RepID=UPI001FE68D55|nr:nucleotide exchange factor GrpE [Nocardioides dongxiaopingii]
MTDPRDEVPSDPQPAGAGGDDVAEDLPDTSGADGRVEDGGPLESQGVADVTEAGDATASPAEADELTLARIALEERTLDLQRLQAEYLNYKRRVERDREKVVQNATYAALAPITEVLDNIDRARESAQSHGQGLDGGFKAVADQLERTVAAAGLLKFGEPGDAFDPTFHEALAHQGEDPEVSVTTVKVVAKAGYRIGERVVRAAQVLVVDPAGG